MLLEPTNEVGCLVSRAMAEVFTATKLVKLECSLDDLRGSVGPLAMQSRQRLMACYEEAQRKVTGEAEISAVSVYWANRAKR